MQGLTRVMGLLAMGALLFVAVGCTTKAAKKAMDKVHSEDAFAGFDRTNEDENSREVKTPDPISEDTEPEKAVDQLIDYLQRADITYQVPAEDQLRLWAMKQGVADIIVRKVRLLLKEPRIEVRAPALRLTIAYGKKESLSDLIEVLGDEEYGMREMAFKSLRKRTGHDFGFNPAGGSLARAQALEKWRNWWQDERNKERFENVPARGFDVPEPPKTTESGATAENQSGMLVPAEE